MKHFAHLLLLAILALGFSTVGCATTTRIHVESKKDTNGGEPFYMVVRSTDGKSFVTERYQDIAAKLFAKTQDPATVTQEPIFPGKPFTLTLEEGDKKDLVVYFFFTKPGTNWRVPLRKPLPAEVLVELGANDIQKVQVRKR